jgi:PAS domain S-box-containing protein
MRPDEDTPSAPIDSDELIASLPCGIVSFDDEGRVLFANATLRAMLGYGEGELEGAHFERMLTVAGKIFYQTHLFPLLRLHGAAREVFLLMRSKSGGDVGALASVTRSVRDGQGVSHCVLMEVHERRKYEEELLRARQAADRANTELATHARMIEEVLERERAQSIVPEVALHILEKQAHQQVAQVEMLIEESGEPIERIQAEPTGGGLNLSHAPGWREDVAGHLLLELGRSGKRYVHVEGPHTGVRAPVIAIERQ